MDMQYDSLQQTDMRVDGDSAHSVFHRSRAYIDAPVAIGRPLKRVMENDPDSSRSCTGLCHTHLKRVSAGVELVSLDTGVEVKVRQYDFARIVI